MWNPKENKLGPPRLLSQTKHRSVPFLLHSVQKWAAQPAKQQLPWWDSRWLPRQFPSQTPQNKVGVFCMTVWTGSRKRTESKLHKIVYFCAGFVRHLENLDFLEFWDLSFMVWNSLNFGIFSFKAWNSLNFGIFLSRPGIPWILGIFLSRPGIPWILGIFLSRPGIPWILGFFLSRPGIPWILGFFF